MLFGVGLTDAAFLCGTTIGRLQYAERIGALKVPSRINNRPCYSRAMIEDAKAYFSNRPSGTRRSKQAK